MLFRQQNITVTSSAIAIMAVMMAWPANPSALTSERAIQATGWTATPAQPVSPLWDQGFAEIRTFVHPRSASPDRHLIMSASQSEAHHGIRIACTPCHRKKITCNKKLPCERCARLKLACDERFSDRYKNRPPTHRSEPSASAEAESSAQTGQNQVTQSIERERTGSVGSSRSGGTSQSQAGASFSSQPASQHLNRRVVGLQDLLNKTPAPDTPSDPLEDVPRTPPLATPAPASLDEIRTLLEPQHEPWHMRAPPRPLFYRGSYPFASFEKYLEATAPEVFEFAHDGAGLVSDSAIQAGVQFRLSSAQYAGVPKIWLYRSSLLESISQHLQSSGEQGYGEEGYNTVSYGISNTMIISCFTIFSGKGRGRHGLVLPTNLGGIMIQWQRPINLLTFRNWRKHNNLK
ncbi:hypothetical protein B0T21DRAFT_361772 [Apiosordaria backusii]|uniref:Zn(2)-C6 fungal-type domain-containing protein n=1 Tax=Apiosordaria backusii TaxID=314023 RepID=A0AA40BRE5_9PEZI|nr:hypothetical protein B0T21DRAFT_361772 [Apiosordaria backusii]